MDTPVRHITLTLSRTVLFSPNAEFKLAPGSAEETMLVNELVYKLFAKHGNISPATLQMCNCSTSDNSEHNDFVHQTETLPDRTYPSIVKLRSNWKVFS